MLAKKLDFVLMIYRGTKEQVSPFQTQKKKKKIRTMMVECRKTYNFQLGKPTIKDKPAYAITLLDIPQNDTKISPTYAITTLVIE